MSASLYLSIIDGAAMLSATIIAILWYYGYVEIAVVAGLAVAFFLWWRRRRRRRSFLKSSAG